MKRRHHFVPRFYLGRFASEARRINIFNLSRSQVIKGASVRDQCFAHRLYGPDDRIENAFAAIEGIAAPLLGRIVSDRRLPSAGSEDHFTLCFFVSLQLVRTTAQIGAAAQMSAAFATAVFGNHVPASHVPTREDLLAMAIRPAPELSATIADLKAVLVQAPQTSLFVTSDNPTFRYNQYCERILHAGVTGTKCTGFQLVFPLSPLLTLLLFDPEVYRANVARSPDRVMATMADVDSLNRMQFVSASENIYFSDWSFAAQCPGLHDRVLAVRANHVPTVISAVEEASGVDASTRSELIHQFWPMPQLDIGLSFLSIRPEAARVRLLERAQSVRASQRSQPARDHGFGDRVRRFNVTRP